MSGSDIAILKKLAGKIGRPFRFVMQRERCVVLDLTANDYVWGGLIRHHSVADKQEILGLVARLTGLRELNLRRNRLFHLPEEFGNLRDLEVLNLGSNYLGQVPPQLRNCTRLRYLQLGNNDLTALPTFMADFTELEYLTLHKNIRLKSVDNLSGLTRLKHLNLHYLNLLRMPPFVCKMKDLVTLTLWNVREIPDEIAELKNLQFFSNCGSPGFKHLPESFTHLRKLRMVRLFQNNLETLPENIGDLAGLEQVSLYQNQLFRLPESFSRLQNLRKLNLGWNRFKAIPECLKECRSLEWLAMFANPIKPNDPFPLPQTTQVLRAWPFTTLEKGAI